MIARVAFVAFPRMTLLDLVGAYDALRRAPGVQCEIVGTTTPVDDESGVRLVPASVYPDLAPFDLLVVPGGLGTRPLVDDERCIEWLRGWGSERPIASVCTGALLLGRAGHLAGKRATTHHGAFDQLAPLCAQVVRDRRIVDEGRVVTAAGVSAALDLGLFLVERFFGAAERLRIAAQMEYRHYSAD